MDDQQVYYVVPSQPLPPPPRCRWECQGCGAVVHNTVLHDQWHARQDRPLCAIAAAGFSEGCANGG